MTNPNDLIPRKEIEKMLQKTLSYFKHANEFALAYGGSHNVALSTVINQYEGNLQELSQIESVNPQEVIEGLVYQFGYEDKGKIHTGGLSALEHAFDYLGWDDPHILPPPIINKVGK